MQRLETQGYENEGIGKCRDGNAGIGIPGMTSISRYEVNRILVNKKEGLDVQSLSGLQIMRHCDIAIMRQFVTSS